MPCEPNNYGEYEYDPITGCLIWTCLPCPDFNEEDGMNMCCLMGFPCKQTNVNGCLQWGCCSEEIIAEYIDE